MPQTSQSNKLGQVAKAGFGGVCSIYLVFFGVFLGFVGTILVATSYDSNFHNDFFESSNRGKRIAGFILLAASVICLVIGICLCCYVCKTFKEASSSTTAHGTVLNTAPLVSGTAAPGPVSGYHVNQPTYQGGGQPYVPPPQQQYPPPPQQPYAPPPQQPYAPPPQQPYAPQPQYPPPQQQPYAPPAQPTAPAYAPAPGYPPQGPSEYLPPPSYNEASALPVKGGVP